jgi:predicted ABC-type transport system involved in lysophospholipase L1 biosynthesis ATPase subunit
MTTRPVVREALAACHDVSVTYGSGDTSVRALGGVSVALRAGEGVALLGRSGSGKTTLLHALGGLVEPTSGSVEWRGQPLMTIDRAARTALRARGIAFVFQGSNLLPHFTAFENVAFVAQLAGGEARPGLAAPALLGLVGLGAKLDHLPSELSGGEAQRVAIARALAQRPDLLLCDEPTGHLDTDTAERVLDLIDALQDEFGFALVVATHSTEVAARYHREVEIEDGVVVREERVA